jgi:uncharacterized metal-binding protein YceD (DUF177 family)
MDDIFKIFIDRLKDGHEEYLEESYDPQFMDIHEAELCFRDPIELRGKASVRDGTLVLHFILSTIAVIPCAICNCETEVKIAVDFYHTESISGIPSGIFDFAAVIREAILLELPYTIECHGGNCPERETITKFLKKGKKDEGNETYPFSDL